MAESSGYFRINYLVIFRVTVMKQAVFGILAPVDAGKTTLSEGMLYRSGAIRTMGRVDRQDAFLDTYELEKKRGITIFSKQAKLNIGELSVTLVDTPGHIDFSGEMERTLQVLDYGILVISATDGVQPYTETIWRLLSDYGIPVFLFVNKMDIFNGEKETLLQEMRKRLDNGIIDFTADPETVHEEAAVLTEGSFDEYMEQGVLSEQTLSKMIADRKLFPCFFGSARNLAGIDFFLSAVSDYTLEPDYPSSFGARVYKITRDEQNTRLTFLKLTGGTLRVKDALYGTEKINQIRKYSGAKFETVQEIHAGEIAALTGLTDTFAGQGLGYEKNLDEPLLKPVLTYRVILPEGVKPEVFLPMLKKLEEEEPLLDVIWNENLAEIQICVMGEIQLQILKSLVLEKYDLEISFDEGSILYKETIAAPAYGVGHFEPLRHYAEVHFLMEPLPQGFGLVFETACSENILDKNWQRLTLTHLSEKQHIGVLTGSPITDMKITLVSGRAHNKHTEGGDFRQAVYRGVRQGLTQAESVLLEPYYEFRLQLPEAAVGRAMTDLDARNAVFRIAQGDAEMTEIQGIAPVRTLRNYQSEILSYTHGEGRMQCMYAGYFQCKDASAVIREIGYDFHADVDNPADSVFCANGAGYIVPYDEVYLHMHMPFAVSGFSEKRSDETEIKTADTGSYTGEDGIEAIGIEEIDAILDHAGGANRRREPLKKKRRYKEKPPVFISKEKIKKNEVDYLLVDGYNIIYAWDETKALISENMDGARGILMDTLCNYQALKGCEVILVFDAYRIAGHKTETVDYQNIHVVYTKEAETADQYIEKFAHSNQDKYNITVATSDGMEQLIIRGAGCRLLSAKELKIEIDTAVAESLAEYHENQ